MATLVATLVLMGEVRAQNNAPKAAKNDPNAKARAKKAAAGPAKAQAPRGGPAAAADPLAPDAQAGIEAGAPGTYHYTLKLTVADRTTLAANYYPSKLGINASAVLLVHEKDRSSEDFEEPIADIKGEGLAEYLQGQGHTVLSIDLRGHGANPRRPTTPKDWLMMINDLQAAYQFLVDRTNRGELNLAKLAVLGVGEGANLVAAWANQPGGAVSNQGRTSDLCALILISPMADGEGLSLGRDALAPLAPRFPLLVLVAARDQASSDPVRAARPLVERAQFKHNKVEIFDSSLHGFKLLRHEPKITSLITQFLEGAAKYKNVDWEPRYNLAPVPFSDVVAVRNANAADAKAKDAQLPAAAKEKEQEKEKEKEKDAPAKPEAGKARP
jgi:pimeloyl-ACP methyl ester carboxylesterase